MSRLHVLPTVARYATLGETFYSRVSPTPQGEPYRVSVNPAAAALLGLDPEELHSQAALEAFSGQQLPPWAEPLAAVYAGHQFGVYVPQLGDGRALLLGEVVGPDDTWEVQLKGAGPTPYSRMGDGYAVLRSTLREYLASEAMAGLGIPTTRALCVMGSDAPVYRETAETGAILTRLAPSHIRFGTFEYFAHTRQTQALQQLADHVVEHHYPEYQPLSGEARYSAMFGEVVRRTARLIAHWQAVGFCHGVMNSDNMSILGLTIDYGPYGFLDAFDPGHICNHSDRGGRYAYQRQPHIGLWNLGCLAQALLPLVDSGPLREHLEGYGEHYNAAYLEAMGAKLGLSRPREADLELIGDFLGLLAHWRMDFSNSFRLLAQEPLTGKGPLRDHCPDIRSMDDWLGRYRARLQEDDGDDAVRAARMNQVNPCYVLRNYLAQEAIEAAQRHDFAPVDRLLAVLQNPFVEQAGYEHYAQEPPEWGRHLAVSCSS